MEGDRGLTMRALAAKAGMSLSNVQYYFRNKDVLLVALVEDYFDDCVDVIRQIASATDAGADRDERVRQFFTTMLKGSREMVEMCAIFREFWAIATRNRAVARTLDHYYRRYADILCGELFPNVVDERVRESIKLLIVPYLEGYSITGRALEKDPAEVAAMLSRLAASLCQPS